MSSDLSMQLTAGSSTVSTSSESWPKGSHLPIRPMFASPSIETDSNAIAPWHSLLQGPKSAVTVLRGDNPTSWRVTTSEPSQWFPERQLFDQCSSQYWHWHYTSNRLILAYVPSHRSFGIIWNGLVETMSHAGPSSFQPLGSLLHERKLGIERPVRASHYT